LAAALVVAQAGSGQGGPGGPGSGTAPLLDIHNVLPRGGDPFGVANNPKCDAQKQSAVKPVLEMLRKYVSAYDARKPLPSTGEFTIAPHRSSEHAKPAYWLDVEPKDVAELVKSREVDAIFTCSYITVLREDEGRDHGIATQGKRVFLGYSPAIGLFSAVPRGRGQGSNGDNPRSIPDWRRPRPVWAGL